MVLVAAFDAGANTTSDVAASAVAVATEINPRFFI
jgi:hypothetical protein